MDLSAALIYSLYRPSLCNLRPWLLVHGEAPSPPGPFEQVLVRLGQRHEAQHLKQLGPHIDLRYGSIDERVERTRAALTAGERVLYQPVMTARTKLGTRMHEIVGIPDFLISDGGSYRIRDSKLSLHADEDSHPEILRQLELYGWLLEQTYGSPPAALEVWLGDSTLASVPYDGGECVRGLLAELVEVISVQQAPVSPVGWSKCQGCGFRGRCWQAAETRRDVALVYGVDQGLARALREVGVATIEDLPRRFDEAALADFSRPWGSTNRRVGKSAERILAQARAMERRQVICRACPTIPISDNYVMFDVEGMPPHLEEIDKVYLWGTQVFGRDPGQYQAAVADFGPAGDRRGWLDFLDHCRTMFEAYGDIPFVHWHHYERVKLQQYIDRHGDPDGIGQRIIHNLVDLLPITRDAIVLPEPSYSLKVVERTAGFERKLEEYGGDWSMARYIEATETGDETERQAIMQEILDYNREDLEATWAVFTWLASFHEETNEG